MRVLAPTVAAAVIALVGGSAFAGGDGRVRADDPVRRVAEAQSDVGDVGWGRAFGFSKKKNASGASVPPWTGIEVEAYFAKPRPRRGDVVTVVPLTAKLRPLDVKVRRGRITTDEECGGMVNEPPAWLVEPALITRKDFLAAESLATGDGGLDVIGLYPAQKKAGYLSPPQLKRTSLPTGYGLKSLQGGVDLNGNGRPDVLYFIHCCDDFSADFGTAQCGFHTCQSLFVRSRAEWKDVSAQCG